MKFKQSKAPVEPCTRHHDMLEDTKLESSLGKRVRGAPVYTRLDVNQQHALTAKVDGILGCVRRIGVSRFE